MRDWSDELAALFGPGVREEVLAAAADAGRLDAALELDPAAVRPSVELLRTVLVLRRRPAGAAARAAAARWWPGSSRS